MARPVVSRSTRPRRDEWQRILICSDLHGCYLDLKAWKVFLAVLTEHHWDQVILNGDVCDFSQLSAHDKKIGAYEREFRDEITLDEELFFVKTQIFQPLRKATKAKILMRLGNHETRYLSVAERNSEALAQLLKTMRKNRSLYLDDILALDKFGIQLSYNPEDILFDIFTVVHGVKTAKTAAKQNLLTYGNGTSGHTHRMNAYTEMMRGRLHGWWESGCLRTTKKVEYLPFGARPDWSQGFLELHIKPGKFHCLPHFIIDEETIFHGVSFRA